MRLSMLKRILSLVTCTLLFSAAAYAQGTLTGTVTDSQTGETLPSVNIILTELTKGTATGIDGNYELTGIQPGTYTVRVSFIGYSTIKEQITIEPGTNTKSFAMNQDIGMLDEVVVSGVADGTVRKKLTVSVTKVDAAQLNKVPAMSVSGSLAGKVSGVTIRNGSGVPGGESQVQLRADNNLNVSSNPLIIVDGVILEGTMADINPDDIANIEVVKGAAASSLYGSRAGNGVIVITTKRGGLLENGDIDVTVRNEVGIQQLARYIDLADHHAYKLASDWKEYDAFTKYDGVIYPDGYQGGFHPDVQGSRDTENDHYMDNPYSNGKDPQKSFFQNGNNYTNYISLATRVDKINLFGSFENSSQNGIIPNTGGYDRKNFRINADYNIANWLKISATNLIINAASDIPGGSSVNDDGNSGIFFNVVLAEPDNNFFLSNPDGQPYFYRHNQWSNETNPLYTTYKNERNETRHRFLGNYNVKANPLDWLEYQGSYSIENINNRYTSYYPYDTYTLGGSDPYGLIYSEGSLYKFSNEQIAQTSQHKLITRHQLGKLYTKVTLSYLWEDNHYESYYANGSDFKVRGLPRFQAMDTDDISAGSYIEDVRAENYFAITSFDWDDKFLVDAMLRRDGSSLFGPNNRWNNYYRLSAAYRVTEDFDIPYFNELKIRAAQGTAGIRPEFSWQYETFEVDAGNTSKEKLGNKNLQPSHTTETEFAINGTVSNRVNFELSYANSTTENQFLEVPLLPIAGYTHQWQNAGTIESKSFEVNLQSDIIQKRNLTWNVGLTWSKSVQEISKLDVPAYQDGPSGLFYMREGEEYGAIYGYDWVTTLDQMSQQLPEGDEIGDYHVNSEGYVIKSTYIDKDDGKEKAAEGSQHEAPIKLLDEYGDAAFVQIGNGRPDWTAGITNTISYKGFSAYILLDIKHGGDIYNRKSQWLTRDNRLGILDQNGKSKDEKKTFDYYKGFYDVNSNNSYWVEDGGYVKFREVSISYQFGQEQLAKVFGNALKSATISAIGRNLYTFTNYSGYDPEVGSIRTPYDGTGRYPNFRNYALSLSLKF